MWNARIWPTSGRGVLWSPARAQARWRWVFWLILVAFAAGSVRRPVAVLQLSGQMVPEGPDWYVIVQGVIGVIHVSVAVAMFAGYRRSGPGPF